MKALCVVGTDPEAITLDFFRAAPVLMTVPWATR